MKKRAPTLKGLRVPVVALFLSALLFCVAVEAHGQEPQKKIVSVNTATHTTYVTLTAGETDVDSVLTNAPCPPPCGYPLKLKPRVSWPIKDLPQYVLHDVGLFNIPEGVVKATSLIEFKDPVTGSGYSISTGPLGGISGNASSGMLGPLWSDGEDGHFGVWLSIIPWANVTDLPLTVSVYDATTLEKLTDETVNVSSPIAQWRWKPKGLVYLSVRIGDPSFGCFPAATCDELAGGPVYLLASYGTESGGSFVPFTP